MKVEWSQRGTSFELLTTAGLDVAGPLPEAVTRVWQPADPRRVGATLTKWAE